MTYMYSVNTPEDEKSTPVVESAVDSVVTNESSDPQDSAKNEGTNTVDEADQEIIELEDLADIEFLIDEIEDQIAPLAQ